VSTVPKDPLSPPIQPPDTDKAAPITGKGQVNIGPPRIGAGSWQGEPTTGLGKGNIATPEPTSKPFKSD